MILKHSSGLIFSTTLFGLLTTSSAIAQVTEAEPNNTSAQSLLPSSTTTVNGELSLDIDGDFDFSERLSAEEIDSFSVSGLTPSTPFYALIDNGASDVDTVLGSFDAKGNLVKFDDDSSPLGSVASALSGSVNEDGTINLKVTGFDDFDFNGNHDRSGEYDLFITLGTDTFSSGDVDFFESPVKPGQGFTAEVFSEFDSLVGVFAEGSLIDTDEGTGVVRGLVPESNLLNLAVTGLNDSQFAGKHSETGFYSLVLNIYDPLPTNPNPLIVNNGFEAGDFTGWETVGQTNIESFVFSNNRGTEGRFQALLTTGGGAVSTSSLESFLGLDANSLDEVRQVETIEGSAILQEFTANEGDQLTFDFNFLTNELVPEEVFNDFAFVSVTSPNELANTFSSAFVSSLSSFEAETGFGTFSYDVPASGTYTLGVGVTDVEDNSIDSGVLVDNVQLNSTSVPGNTSVPEPVSVLGLIAFGIGAGCVFKRQP